VQPTPRIIKRYANRKLYDTSTSSYITLEEIAGLIRDGEALRIVDNVSKEDLTSVTLAQVLVEDEKRQKRDEPKGAGPLRGMLEQGSELLNRTLGEPVQQWRSTVEDSVARLLRTGEDRAQEKRQLLQSWIDQNTQALEDLQARLDERFKHAVGAVGPLAQIQRELTTLRTRIDRIEAHLGIVEHDDEASRDDG
jgi:hypothetical protein